MPSTKGATVYVGDDIRPIVEGWAKKYRKKTGGDCSDAHMVRRIFDKAFATPGFLDEIIKEK